MIQDLIKKYENVVKTWKQRHQLYDRTAMKDADKKALCDYIIEDLDSILKDLRELEGKVSEKEIDAAALEYAQKASAAPDKETPEWVCTDFKAGVNWVKHAFENSNPLQR